MSQAGYKLCKEGEVMRKASDWVVGATAASASIIPAWAVSTMNAAKGLPTGCTGVCGTCGGSCLSGLGIIVLLGAGVIKKYTKKDSSSLE